ncbi:MAG: RNA-binding S4 domain-containing protein [Thermoanaerobacterales bacterium]|nr:RNA-binding S4 domain-containing protein [Bacillota bacterium]MDI6907268.1 RNA-binding S4 domain-containing protein [Thermoanaerobacterales bacterium]
MRLDKFLKVSRLIKRRTLANEACDRGLVTLNGRVAKAGALVRPGDVLALRLGSRLIKVEVLAVEESVPAKDASGMYRLIADERISE